MLSTVKESYFQDDTDSFTLDNGFAVAVAFINEDDLGAPLDPAYGTIKMMESFWGLDENDEYFYGRREIESQHYCSEEELGFT